MMKKLNVEKIADLWAVGIAVLGGVSFYSFYKYGKNIGTFKGLQLAKNIMDEEFKKSGKH